MSIVTRTGDDGTTGLMYNRRVSKTDPRVEAYGTVDELNAALGLARAGATSAGGRFVADLLYSIQKDLVILMGEVATAPEDLGRYRKDGFQVVEAAMTGRLEEIIREIERQEISYHGWATPGENPLSAGLDLARTVCRRAERRLAALRESGALENNEIQLFMNRLSDLLWLLARWTETPAAGRPGSVVSG